MLRVTGLGVTENIDRNLLYTSGIVNGNYQSMMRLVEATKRVWSLAQPWGTAVSL